MWTPLFYFETTALKPFAHFSPILNRIPACNRTESLSIVPRRNDVSQAVTPENTSKDSHTIVHSSPKSLIQPGLCVEGEGFLSKRCRSLSARIKKRGLCRAQYKVRFWMPLPPRTQRSRRNSSRVKSSSTAFRNKRGRTYVYCAEATIRFFRSR